MIPLPLGSGDGAIARVAERVRQGGHDIPAGVMRRRFAAGLRNLDAHYKNEVDAWAVYDSAGNRPTLIEWSQKP